MGADLIFDLLTHPVCLVFWLGLLATSCFVAYRNPTSYGCIPPWRLVTGYFGVFLACIAISALASYMSPDEASRVWHVPLARYWQVMMNEFFSNLMVTMMIGTTGIAIVGLPVIFRLARAGRARIGWVLLTSTAISIVFSLVFSAFFLISTQPWVDQTLKLIKISASAHLLVALCFCVGAGLRWRNSKTTA
jgi:hypothetical protein